MKRRKFIQNTTLGSTGLLFSGVPLFTTSCKSSKDELSLHTIDKVELAEVHYEWPRLVGKNGVSDVHGQKQRRPILKIYTDQGAMGWGITNWDVKKELDILNGKKLSELISPESGIADGLNVHYFDVPLFDLMGMVLNKPIHEILGGKGGKEHKVYSGMIYMDELPAEKFGHQGGLDVLMENCAWDYDYGYRQFKLKIGRGHKWYPSKKEGMDMDIKVTKMIYEEYKDKGVDILVDANNAYDYDDTIAFLEGIGDIPLYWFEEPFPEENKMDVKRLRNWMDDNGFENTRYADGEWIWVDPNKPDVVLEQIESGMINTYLNDIHAIGFTNWMKIMPRLAKVGATASPHTWGQGVKTNYTAHMATGLGSIETIEGVTCLSEDIDFGNYPIKEGFIQVSDAPGFGMKLLKS
ncbi:MULTISPECIES: enolase C-terminal domain-like protein [Flavobacteriaceae]|uniref:enolase C-terminal domain-like protein n=1 Tax=Flavobacteriaceae TaxID=49546 RepID=UPI0014915504|nr:MULTISPECIES: enolase C-terminal domain-like protein [Allomuricauda]MDC6365878.1 enolase C-terminal domain-like protein [Muricauda sp. AC10]